MKAGELDFTFALQLLKSMQQATTACGYILGTIMYRLHTFQISFDAHLCDEFI